MHRFLLALPLLALGGCATVPQPLAGEFAATLPDAGAPPDSRVRWGGGIIEVNPKAGETCFQILARELGASARPRLTDASGGRFVACRDGFYDPAVFTAGREVTVVGRVAGTEVLTIGEHRLTVPRVAAEVVYLWRERQERYYGPDPFWWHSPWHDPFWPRPYYRYWRHPHPAPAAPQPAPAPSAPPPGG